MGVVELAVTVATCTANKNDVIKLDDTNIFRIVALFECKNI